MGYMEGDRLDYDHPLLFGMRISARPLEGLEIKPRSDCAVVRRRALVHLE